MEEKIPEAPFELAQSVWQRPCTLDMGLKRVEHYVAEILFEKGEWRIRVEEASLDSYPACYFQDYPAEAIETTNPGRKVPRYT